MMIQQMQTLALASIAAAVCVLPGCGMTSEEANRKRAERDLAVLEALERVVQENVPQQEAEQLRTCTSHLKRLHVLASAYADDNSGKFPFDNSTTEPKAYESLQLLASWDHQRVPPELLVCPAQGATPATKTATGEYTLDQNSCSYWYVHRRTRNTDKGDLPLFCCRNHKAGFVFVNVAGTVTVTDVEVHATRGLVGNE